jgi:VWFA-related protein
MLNRSAVLFLSALVPSFLLAQPALEERVDVNLVLIDAVVTDARGNQILGLEEADFIVTENEVEQTIEAVDYFTSRRLVSSPEERAPFRVERVREERYFIFFFHNDLDLAGQPLYSALHQARRGAIDFIEKRMQPNDRVAIVTYDARLKIFSDFSGDRKHLLSALDEVGKFSRGLTAAQPGTSPSIFDHLDVREMTHGAGRVFEGIQLLAEALRPIPARKVMFVFSAGMGEVRMSDNLRWVAPMIGSLNRSNISVYAMNLQSDGRYRTTEDALSRMAAETGGEYYRTIVSYATPIRLAERKNAGYYMISYYAPKKPAGEFQRVQVRLRNPEFRVNARPGYMH